MYANGDIYAGEWVENFRHGIGTCRFQRWNSFYEGSWLKDRHHGRGVYAVNESIVRYEGEWKDGRRHGKGRQVCTNSSFLSLLCVCVGVCVCQLVQTKINMDLRTHARDLLNNEIGVGGRKRV